MPQGAWNSAAQSIECYSSRKQRRRLPRATIWIALSGDGSQRKPGWCSSEHYRRS